VERALNLTHLRLALGEGGALPSAEELQVRLAEAEIALFLQRGHVADDLLATAWYLHAVGSSRPALELYTVDRQRRANQVSAHIFDLALSSAAVHPIERREMIFAAQVGSLRGGLDPNSRALFQRRPESIPRLLDKWSEVSLDIGSSLLALDRVRLFPRLQQLRDEAERLRSAVGVSDLINTPYGAAARVIEGCYEVLVHLTYDRPERLGRAQVLFAEAVTSEYSRSDIDSRWVAANLSDISDDLGRSSIWAHRPASVPPTAAMAMTLGDPPVLSLWPPQYELLSMTPNPLDPSVKRLLLSFPTSGGKTLIAQYLVTAHVSRGLGAACIVVPTHSLGREVQRDLNRRLGVMGGHVEDAGPIGLPVPSSPQAIVMTPEKFAAHLRTEPERMLRDFSLFVIDEAHLVGDASRGWMFESALSFLHASTLGSHHRIALLSAALGNRTHIGSWLSDAGQPPLTFHHDWRGPRRAHALFGTDANWDEAVVVPPRTKSGLMRQSVPLHGTVHVRTAPQTHRSLRTSKPIATLVLKRRRDVDEWKKDDASSDPQYRIRARMATILAAHGSVLVVESTKQTAQRMASAIAAEIAVTTPETAPLLALTESRLGASHPLAEPLRKGVGFHHAALPDDIQAELENGLRQGILRYLVATTTLIEGINFPVRSVLIGDRGYHTSEGYVTTLDAPKLVNAIGRAGRAGRETEGWVVLALNEPFTETSFDPLTADDKDLVATSRLSTAEGLDMLAAFEASLRRGEDAIMEFAGSVVADFVSHVWFVAHALHEVRASVDPVSVSLESTLAWQQLDTTDRRRWQNVAALSADRYKSTPEAQRRRWAQTGTSLSTASALEHVASDIRTELPSLDGRQDPVEAFRLVSAGGRLQRLLSLRESRFRAFRPRRNAAATAALTVETTSVILDWLNGRDIAQIGEAYLTEVADETYRHEQLSEFTSTTLEHFLPWVLSTIVAWVNEGLLAADQLCPDLPAYVRYGVNSPVSLELARGGIRSRRLVHLVARSAETATTSPIREWLAQSDVRHWAAAFDASPSELADLLFFTRVEGARITSRVLGGEAVRLPLTINSPAPPGPVTVAVLNEAVPARIAALRADTVLGYVGASLQDDVSRLLATGVPIQATLTDDSSLEIKMDNPTDSPGWFVANLGA
jgi:hypothetical protein